MSSLRIGWAFCGSFCTLDTVMEQVSAAVLAGHHIIPIFSDAVTKTDTRFGTAEMWRAKITALCGCDPLTDITAVEPLGPKNMLDVLVVAPCTGSTLSKLAAGDSSTAVTLAVKSHLRRERPVVLAVSTNDALSGSFPSIATLKNRKYYYFVPMHQDAPQEKPNSLVADFSRIGDTITGALEGRQIQPLFLGKDGL